MVGSVCVGTAVFLCRGGMIPSRYVNTHTFAEDYLLLLLSLFLAAIRWCSVLLIPHSAFLGVYVRSAAKKCTLFTCGEKPFAAVIAASFASFFLRDCPILAVALAVSRVSTSLLRMVFHVSTPCAQPAVHVKTFVLSG